MTDILCPYCMNKITPGGIKYGCPNCGTEAHPSMIERARHMAPVCRQPGCDRRLATDRKCPKCGANLPSDILDYSKYLRFSILGISGAGKSNFLTTMLHEMRSSGLPWVLTPMDPDTQTVFRGNEKLIYEDAEPVPATPPGTPPQPQQWKIQDTKKMTNRIIPSYSLTIFDGAGEDQQNIDPKISKYIAGSRTLVILIDPLALPGVRRLVKPDVLSWSSSRASTHEAAADLVNGLASYIRTSANIKTGKLIDKDVAVVFTKMDAVFDSFGTATVTQPGPHVMRQAFMEADADAVDLEIRDWLMRQGEQSFLNAITVNFGPDRVRYFGVSSFGQPPTGPNRLGRVLPHRVLDPLMWVLAKEGIIPAKS